VGEFRWIAVCPSCRLMKPAGGEPSSRDSTPWHLLLFPLARCHLPARCLPEGNSALHREAQAWFLLTTSPILVAPLSLSPCSNAPSSTTGWASSWQGALSTTPQSVRPSRLPGLQAPTTFYLLPASTATSSTGGYLSADTEIRVTLSVGKMQHSRIADAATRKVEPFWLLSHAVRRYATSIW